jgi:YD repeat-containing protein
MKKLSETYKELGIAFTFPIKIKDENGNETYFENSDRYWVRCEYDETGKATYYETSGGLWFRREYDEKGNLTYFEDSHGFWARYEYDKKGKETYYEDRDGIKRGTKRSSCDGKVIEVDGKKLLLTILDGKKYKLTEL